MAKDFLVDLTHTPDDERENAPERSIRNITVNRRAPGGRAIDPRETRPSKRNSSAIIWVVAVLLLLMAGGGAALMLFTKTEIQITPRAHHVAFDSQNVFTAYPSGTENAPIEYRVVEKTLEDSQTVAAQGTEHVEDRATGSITIYNDYSDSTVRLIKNTRFETPDGLVFRIPASVIVPGRTAAGPGKIVAAVIADSPGPSFNVGPFQKMTIPGLKSTEAMFKGVYASSDAPFAGGFVGDRPAVAAADLDKARAELRTRLEDAVRSAIKDELTDVFAFPQLMQISFSDLATEPDGSTGARVKEGIVARIPVFDKTAFSSSIARSVSADAGDSQVQLVPADQFAAALLQQPQNLGSDPLQFSLSGQATIVWTVDKEALISSLLGKDKDAFEAITAQFPGIEKAEAHLAPFWAGKFPSSRDRIVLTLEDPAVAP